MNLYKYDTHVHTSETSPCGNISAAELVHLYKDASYHGVVITDHYYKSYFDSLGDISWNDKVDCYLKGYRLALAEGKKIGLNVMLGMELRFNENFNDYLIYGIDENFLKENKKLYELDLRHFRELANKKDLLIYQAHPFRPFMIPADPQMLDGVEVFNGNLRHNSKDAKALEYAETNDLKLISGSDFHEYEDLARGGIIASELVNSSMAFVRILNENKVIELITSE